MRRSMLLEADLVAEKASSLGHHGRLVEQAMAALGRSMRRRVAIPKSG